MKDEGGRVEIRCLHGSLGRPLLRPWGCEEGTRQPCALLHGGLRKRVRLTGVNTSAPASCKHAALQGMHAQRKNSQALPELGALQPHLHLLRVRWLARERSSAPCGSAWQGAIRRPPTSPAGS